MVPIQEGGIAFYPVTVAKSLVVKIQTRRSVFITKGENFSCENIRCINYQVGRVEQLHFVNFYCDLCYIALIVSSCNWIVANCTRLYCSTVEKSAVNKSIVSS